MERFRKRGFTLTELAVTAFIVSGLVVAIVAAVGTGRDVAQNNVSAADGALSQYAGLDASSAGSLSAACSMDGFGAPTSDWHIWIHHSSITSYPNGTVRGDAGEINLDDLSLWGNPISAALGADYPSDGVSTGWQVKICDEPWLPLTFRYENVLLPDGNTVANIADALSVIHGVSFPRPAGTPVQLRAPTGEYSNIWVLPVPLETTPVYPLFLATEQVGFTDIGWFTAIDGGFTALMEQVLGYPLSPSPASSVRPIISQVDAAAVLWLGNNASAYAEQTPSGDLVDEVLTQDAGTLALAWADSMAAAGFEIAFSQIVEPWREAFTEVIAWRCGDQEATEAAAQSSAQWYSCPMPGVNSRQLYRVGLGSGDFSSLYEKY